MTTPELNEVKWNRLKFSMLKASIKEVYDIEIEAKQIKPAFVEGLSAMREKGIDTPFYCGHCNVPIDETSSKCWACGSTIKDESDEPEIDPDELVQRAIGLKIDVEGKTQDELIGLIEAVERRKRDRKRGELSGVESAALNERISQLIGEGWRKKRTGQYTGYWDGNGKRRVAVFHRGLLVHFSVDDGDLVGFDGIEFYDAAERKRRHYGRVNFAYVGDISKDAYNACKFVIEKYQ